MANTYTQIHLHFVFAVKYRQAVISKVWRDELYKYITGIVQNNGHKLLIINGVEDHVHMLVGMRPVQSVSDLMQDVKAGSSKWINERKLIKGKFEWQAGYGAFSYSLSNLANVISYINTQEEHHRKTAFKDEYNKLLTEFKVVFDDKYVFDDLI
ncbi:MAG: IS200/IS605 family transposase [Bacteroidia bacterium]|nr:IS200/IS605 family transposase [Bacteroidia bacterium]